MAVPSRVPFPFIVGRGRSGTTLLRAMLDSHPSVAVPPESHVLARIGRHRRQFERGGRLDTAMFADAVRVTWTRRWALQQSDLLDALEAARPITFQDGVRTMFSAYAQQQHKQRYADKTPINVRNIAFLASLFPEARFIHIIRDGRDVSVSYLSLDFGPDSVGESALHWKHAVEQGRSEGQGLGAQRYREVRYEELVNDPEGVIREICTFIDLPFDEAMLRYFERHEVETMRQREPHHHHLDKPPVKGLRDWRSEMPQKDVAVFEALAGSTLERFGYARELRHVPAAAWVQAGLELASFNARRVGRRAEKRLRTLSKRFAHR